MGARRARIAHKRQSLRVAVILIGSPEEMPLRCAKPRSDRLWPDAGGGGDGMIEDHVVRSALPLTPRTRGLACTRYYASTMATMTLRRSLRDEGPNVPALAHRRGRP